MAGKKERQPNFLAAYRKHSLAFFPPSLLSGNLESRKGRIVLFGKSRRELEKVRRQLIPKINSFFLSNPSAVDDTRLVFQAKEKRLAYEKEGRRVKLTIWVEIELSDSLPCCCHPACK
ncbi:MAG: hypothetical protein N3G22_01345 [Candidatus Micrarchaeota archaeon]|nr:hypothetical protein [Candidatus Micrarchaeota archaeon]